MSPGMSSVPTIPLARQRRNVVAWDAVPTNSSGLKAEVHRTTVCQWDDVSGHTTRAPPVRFELATNGIQFYA